jgi:hypothetical protein
MQLINSLINEQLFIHALFMMDIFIRELWPRYAPLRYGSLLHYTKPGAAPPEKAFPLRVKGKLP